MSKLYVIVGDDSAEGEFVPYNSKPDSAEKGKYFVLTDKALAEKIVAWLNLPTGRMTETWCRYKVYEQDTMEAWPFPDFKEPT